MPEYLVAKAYNWGCIDNLELELTGLLRLNGWAKSHSEGFAELTLFVNGHKVTPIACYRTYRPDVAKAIGSADLFHGIAFEYMLQALNDSGIFNFQVNLGDKQVFDLRAQVSVTSPDYAGLFSLPVVLHRDNIYCSGPPVSQVAPEILALAATVPGPTLDFGCGIGALIRELRTRGINVAGIELDRPAVAENLRADVRPYVRLYDGNLPLPFKDCWFESVVCFEVLEHIRNYEDVLAELARITHNSFVLSVPDMSAVPLCHPHNVVPWHLLESTHLNFFTQTSLTLLLQKYFKEIGLVRISPIVVNGTKFYGSLAAICRK